MDRSVVDDNHASSESSSTVLDKAFLAVTRLDAEKVAWIVLIVIALLSRTIGLGDRAMSHDESLHAVYSFQLFDGRGYQHQPMMHGPLKFILNAGMYFLFGVNDWSARIEVALFGVLMIGLLWMMRPWLGRVGAFLAAAMFAISPALLFYSRYIRDEVMLCALLILWVIAMFRYLQTRSMKWLLWTTVAVAFAFLTMEASFIFGALFGGFLILALAAQLWASEWAIAERRHSFRILIGIAVPIIALGVVLVMFRLVMPGLILLGIGVVIALLATLLVATSWRTRMHEFAELDLIVLLASFALPFASALVLKALGWEIGQFNNPGQISLSMVWQGALVLVFLFIVGGAIGWFWLRSRWLVAAGIFWAIEILFFTTFLTNGQGLGTGLIGSLGYWIDQQAVMRGGQPWYYFYLLVPLYEFLPLVLSVGGIIAWAVSIIRRRRQRAVQTVTESTQAQSPKQGSQLMIEPTPSKSRSPLSVQTLFDAFLVWWVLATWVVFTYVGEKMAWHTVYFATSMALLGALWLGRLIESIRWREIKVSRALVLMGLVPLLLIALRAFLVASSKQPFANVTLNGLSDSAAWILALVATLVLVYFVYDRIAAIGWGQSIRLIALSVVGVLAILTWIVSYRFSFINYDYATEPMVYAHGTPDIKLAVSQIEEISRKTAGDHALKFSYDDDSTWPLEWYFRDYPNKIYYAANPSRDNMDVPVVIVGDKNLSKVKPYLGNNYYEFKYRLIWWPRETYKGLTWQRIIDGIRDPAKRKEFWDAVIYRRYSISTAEWDPVHRFSMFVRKDVAAQVWDWGAAPATAAETSAQQNLYEKGRIDHAAIQEIGQVGVAGTAIGQFSFPRAVTVDASGNIYVADSGNNRVQVFDSKGTPLRQWGTTCKLDTGEGCVGDGRGQFNEPWGIAVDAGGNVYVSDTWNHRVQKFDRDGNFVTMWGQFGSTGGELGQPGLFYGPRALAVGQDGNIYVMDTGNKRIQEFSADGDFIAQYGGSGVVEGRFDEPVGLAQDGDGNWYVADTWNMRIQKFDAGFNYLAQWPVEGWTSQSVVNKPALAVDPERNLVYAVDPENYRVLVFTTDGTFHATFGQYGNDEMSFVLPTGIAVGPDGEIYVADGDGHRIMIFPPVP
jgi:predicted membrane-bound mannosyltransferase/DNA-binding beta-propeller fold protein YncE